MWRQLIQENMNADITRRSNNPGIQNFSALVKMAMQSDIAKKDAAEKEATDSRTMARGEVYKKYPSVAAQAAGIDVSALPAPLEDQLTPTWGQQQKVDSLKTGLRMGKVVLGKEFGEPSVYDVKTMEKALSVIQEAGLSPELFTNELAIYDVVARRIDKKSKRAMVQLRDGRVIWEDTKEIIQ